MKKEDKVKEYIERAIKFIREDVPSLQFKDKTIDWQDITAVAQMLQREEHYRNTEITSNGDFLEQKLP